MSDKFQNQRGINTPHATYTQGGRNPKSAPKEKHPDVFIIVRLIVLVCVAVVVLHACGVL